MPQLSSNRFDRRDAHAKPSVPVVRHDRRFYLLHAWLPLLVFAALTLTSLGMDLDRRLADLLYGLEGHRWQLRHAFVTDTLIHETGRAVSVLAWIGALVAWIASCMRERWAHLRWPLGYLLVATALAAILVAWFKSWSNMDCPWDLVRYGGSRPYVSLFGMRPVGLSRGACFPAGHASSGYAWLSLYFFLWTVKPGMRWLGLLAGLGLGLLFGVSQQLRGAHFLSHDLWSLGICWASALSVHLAFPAHPRTAGRVPSIPLNQSGLVVS